MNGLEHITETFRSIQSVGRTALMPYFTLGYPTPEASVDIITALAHSGADLIELGIPFSDPLADGPTIQYSTQVALEQGMTVRRCLEAVAALRARGVSQPLVLMGYINPILAFGPARFAEQACSAGADGIIVPDMPPEEAAEMEAACREYNLALIYLVSPASTPDRMAALAEHTSGFLYLVSLTGVTGARSSLAPGLADFIRRMRTVARMPLAVGFGISTADQARAVGSLADGVIIGSALIQAVRREVEAGGDPAKAAEAFLSGIRGAMQAAPQPGAAG